MREKGKVSLSSVCDIHEIWWNGYEIIYLLWFWE